MKPEVNDKQEAIIDAAIKRFSHFGVNKTNMTEIADDVAISKQALAYYFADKPSLIHAVTTKILNDYLQQIENAFTAANSVEEALLALIQVKKTFFECYYMLYLQNRSIEIKTGHTEIQNIKADLRKKEQQILVNLLNAGVQKGEINVADVSKTSYLLLDALSAFECAVKVEKVLPNHQDFMEMIEKQREMIHLLMHGLKNASWL